MSGHYYYGSLKLLTYSDYFQRSLSQMPLLLSSFENCSNFWHNMKTRIYSSIKTILTKETKGKKILLSTYDLISKESQLTKLPNKDCKCVDFWQVYSTFLFITKYQIVQLPKWHLFIYMQVIYHIHNEQTERQQYHFSINSRVIQSMN